MGEVALVAHVVDPAAAEGRLEGDIVSKGELMNASWKLSMARYHGANVVAERTMRFLELLKGSSKDEYVGKACLVSTCSGKADLPRARSSIPIFVGKKRCDKV